MFIFSDKSKKAENDEFFNKIYEKYYYHVCEIIKSELYSKVEDDITSCLQDAFMTAYQKIDILKRHICAKWWLSRTARNIVRNFNRRFLIRQNAVIDSSDINMFYQKDFSQEIAEELTFDEYIKQNIAGEFINKMSKEQYKLYYLKKSRELSNEDISKILKISPNAVSLRWRKIIKDFEKNFFKSKK